MKRISFQGEHGAYSEGAAGMFFEDIEPIPCQTFADVLNNTIQDKTEFSMLPVENSLEGTVGESNDLLYSTSLHIIGEIYHKIEHCLIGTGKLEEITTVYSHPQALGQCRKFIQKNNIKTIPTYDTAGSVEIIKKIDKKNIACIASDKASKIYKIPVIDKCIADNSNNYTRFFVLAKIPSTTNNNKTSIIFSIQHKPGALYKIIRNFHDNGVNLTKIMSRPKKGTAWEYNFYVDFEGDVKNPQIAKMLDQIKQHTLFFKMLGSYPKA